MTAYTLEQQTIAALRRIAGEIALQREQLLRSRPSHPMTALHMDIDQSLAFALRELNAAAYTLECGQSGSAWPCRGCSGAGYIPSLPCLACAGKGEVRGQRCEECEGQGWLESILCPMCAGVGHFVPAEGQCPRCGAVNGQHALGCPALVDRAGIGAEHSPQS